MNQFLVRLGKTKNIEYVMPIVNCTVTFLYGAVTFGGHDYLRNILVAQSPSGNREKISNHLRNLITETQDICYKNGWCSFDTKHKIIDWTFGKVRWFASSTLEPITFGSTIFATGLLIGLPNFFNYTKAEDIPDLAFEIKRIALMRSAHDQLQEEKSRIKDEGIGEGETPGIFAVRKIDRKSDEGLKYADSLILSDDAKRFSIARELFYGDSYRSYFKVSVVALSLIMASTLGRAFVMKFNLRQYHITYRLATYASAGACGFANYEGINHLLDQYYAKLADDTAKSLGENYRKGAEEYYTKRALRRNILGLK